KGRRMRDNCFGILNDACGWPAAAALSSALRAALSGGPATRTATMTSRPGQRHADPAFATTLAHGLSVLQAFRHGEPALSNRELADRTGLSKATISRLTTTLMQ